MLKRLTLTMGTLGFCAILSRAWLAPDSTPFNSPSDVVESEVSDWPEFVLPLLEANAFQALTGASVEPFREVLNSADQRIEQGALTEYVFHNRVAGNAEGPCIFRVIVDESRECPTNLESNLQCPEW